MYAFTKPADFEFSREKVLRLAEQQVHGVTSLEGQLSSAWTSDARYYTRPFIAAAYGSYARVRAGPP